MTTKEQEAQLDIGIAKAARILWPNLDEARSFKDKQGRESGKPKFSATFMLPNDSAELAEHKKAVVGLLKAKYGADLKFNAETKRFSVTIDGRSLELALPFHSGDEEAMRAMSAGKDRSFAMGQTFIKTSSQYAVPVFDARQRDSAGVPLAVTDKAAIKATVYSGSFGAGTLKYRTYDKVGTNPPGVTAYLQKICFVTDGEKIAAGASGVNFAAVQGAVVQTSAAAGDDDIAF